MEMPLEVKRGEREDDDESDDDDDWGFRARGREGRPKGKRNEERESRKES